LSESIKKVKLSLFLFLMYVMIKSQNLQCTEDKFCNHTLIISFFINIQPLQKIKTYVSYMFYLKSC